MPGMPARSRNRRPGAGFATALVVLPILIGGLRAEGRLSHAGTAAARGETSPAGGSVTDTLERGSFNALEEAVGFLGLAVTADVGETGT